jgi:UDP-N-acetylglucosamine transferase subunit ALG13
VIFVAIGTTDFDALIQTMDNLSLDLPEKVVMQIGRSAYIPEHCEYFRLVPSLAPYYERASLVVSHGGLGIVTEVLGYGRPLVAVEDPNQPDRHQREILSVWEREGYLI